MATLILGFPTLPCLNERCNAPTACNTFGYCREYNFSDKLRQFPVNLCDAIVYQVAYQVLVPFERQSQAEFISEYNRVKYGRYYVGAVYLVPKLMMSIEFVLANRQRIRDRVKCVSRMLQVLKCVHDYPLPGKLLSEVEEVIKLAESVGIE